MRNCGCFWTTPVINYKGEIFPCVFHAENINELFLGKISESIEFLDIWKGKKIQLLREQSFNGKLDEVPSCKQCNGGYCIPFRSDIFKISDEGYFSENFIFSIPKTLFIEISNSCNLKCIMCHNKFKNKPKFMDLNIFKSICENLTKNNFFFENTIIHLGGESLMHPEILKFLKIIRENKFYNYLILDTNGHFLSPLIIDELLLIDGLFLTFSLDSCSKEVYEKIRVGGDFSKVNSNVRAFLLAASQSPKSRTIRLQFVVQPKNEMEITPFKEFWGAYLENLGVKYKVLVQNREPEGHFPYQIFFKHLTGSGDGGLILGYEDIKLSESKARLDFFKLMDEKI
jgi:radical SAM protein with 4Fe4S-binding SPASM domain